MKIELEKIEHSLRALGYTKEVKHRYTRYSMCHGDSVFIPHTRNKVRATKNTAASRMLERILGEYDHNVHESVVHRIINWTCELT